MRPTKLSPEGKKKISLTIKKESAKVAENLKNKKKPGQSFFKTCDIFSPVKRYKYGVVFPCKRYKYGVIFPCQTIQIRRSFPLSNDTNTP